MNDPEKRAFLFSLSLREKMIPREGHKLIRCYGNYGPIFGTGADLWISDQCDHNHGSYANFPFLYNTEDKKYKNGQDAYCAFTGATKDKFFSVAEYEVYQVTFR